MQKELQAGTVLGALVFVIMEKGETTLLTGRTDKLRFNHTPEYYAPVK